MKSLWSPSKAASLDDLDLIVYASRLIGAEDTLVLGGGGNTSVKVRETDFRGREVDVLRVKASGTQLATVERSGFAGVRLDDVLPLIDRADMTDEAMVEYVSHALVSPGSPRPSIETLLHAFVPYKWVLHSHADAILYLADNELGEELIAEVLGEEIGIIPYRRPGFLMSKAVGTWARFRRDSPGVVLMNHGLVTWADSCEEAYERHIELVSMAEAFVKARMEEAAAKRSQESGVSVKTRFTPRVSPLSAEERKEVAAQVTPALRGALSSRGHRVVTFDDSDDFLEFVSSKEALHLYQAGPATPEHVLYTTPWPAMVDVGDPRDVTTLRNALAKAVSLYEERYLAYFERHRDGESAHHDPIPKLLLVPGVGLWAVGRTKKDSRSTREVYRHIIDVMAGAEAVGRYKSVSEKDIFHIDYWPLELYKLTLRRRPKELEGRIALVTGAARGIGLAIATRLLEEGANVVLTDVDGQTLAASAKALASEYGENVTAIELDVTDDNSVERGFEEVIRAYGGLDILVSNAGIAMIGPIRELPLSTWEKSFAVNATGHFLVARKAAKIMVEQGRGGSLIFVTTKNALAPGRDFGAYSCAKAAEAQLCRILAIEHGSDKIRANMINPDAVMTDLWSPEIKANRAKAYGVPSESFDDFLRDRTLLKEPVTVADVAEAALFLASDRSRVTTGCIITVDAGFREAFPR